MPKSFDEELLRGDVLAEGLKEDAALAVATLVDETLETVLDRMPGTEFARQRKAVQEAYYRELRAALTDPKFTAMAFDRAIEAAVFQAGLTSSALRSSAMSFGIEFVPDVPSEASITSAVAASQALTRGQKYGHLKLRPFLRGNLSRNAENVVREIRTGVGAGLTTPEIVANVRRKVPENRRAVIATVRTVLTTAAGSARETVGRNNSDVVKGIRFTATLDGRTSQQCQSLDGTEWPLGKGPRPSLHFGCRSSFTYVFKGKLSRLQTGGSRAARNPDGGIVNVSRRTSYYDWLGRQNAAFQDHVLGRRKGLLFRREGMTNKRFRELQLDKTFQPRTLGEIEALAG